MNTNNIIEVDMSTKKREIHTSAYYQYDRGLMIRLINVPECNDFSLSIEMCNDGDGAVKHTIAYSGEDVEIPADLLLNGRKVRIFIFCNRRRLGPDDPHDRRNDHSEAVEINKQRPQRIRPPVLIS